MDEIGVETQLNTRKTDHDHNRWLPERMGHSLVTLDSEPVLLGEDIESLFTFNDSLLGLKQLFLREFLWTFLEHVFFFENMDDLFLIQIF